jgi:hypothetical protein
MLSLEASIKAWIQILNMILRCGPHLVELLLASACSYVTMQAIEFSPTVRHLYLARVKLDTETVDSVRKNLSGGLRSLHIENCFRVSAASQKTCSYQNSHRIP